MSSSGTQAVVGRWLASGPCDERGTHLASSHLVGRLRSLLCPDAPDSGMVWLITLLAALAALVTVIVIPASYFFAAQARLQGEIHAGARLYAADVTEAAQQNPRLWNALAGGAHEAGSVDLNIGRRFGSDEPDAVVDRRRVFAKTGELLMDTTGSALVPSPLLQ